MQYKVVVEQVSNGTWVATMLQQRRRGARFQEAARGHGTTAFQAVGALGVMALGFEKSLAELEAELTNR